MKITVQLEKQLPNLVGKNVNVKEMIVDNQVFRGCYSEATPGKMKKPNLSFITSVGALTRNYQNRFIYNFRWIHFIFFPTIFLNLNPIGKRSLLSRLYYYTVREPTQLHPRYGIADLVKHKKSLNLSHSLKNGTTLTRFAS